jgi:hypothetical protein
LAEEGKEIDMATDFTQLQALVSAVVTTEKSLEGSTGADDAAQATLQQATANASTTSANKAAANTAFQQAVTALNSFVNTQPTPTPTPAPTPIAPALRVGA